MSTNRDSTARTAAAITVPDAPEVRVEQANDEEPDVYLEGTAFHAGLNQNAWGLTEQGAQQIADTLTNRDLTASHPPLRDGRYDRSVFGGQGSPIGEVVTAEVVSTDEAMLRDGEYTARYVARVKDPDAKQKYQSGLLTGDDYGVSVGIYGNPEAAVCSVCRGDMAECAHDRFEEVTTGDDGGGDTEASETDADPETQIAGPLYDDGVSDHLAAVYLPAYDGATADVSTAAGGDVAAASASSEATQVPSMAALAASYGTRPEAPVEQESASASAGAADGAAVWASSAVRVAERRDAPDVTTVRVGSEPRVSTATETDEE